jgi:hypothetical protein
VIGDIERLGNSSNMKKRAITQDKSIILSGGQTPYSWNGDFLAEFG